MRIKWRKSNEIEWTVKILPNQGVIIARASLVHVKTKPMIVRKIVFLAKRGSSKTLFEEWYTLEDFKKIVSAEKALAEMEELSDIAVELEEVVNKLIAIKEKVVKHEE
ncbi:MAG: hypothetical protein DRN04_02315 [Thermoprotei archaeon]|mgnify:CR=1 FL=1|nr:MAG: hypothetical protein DRN04_02315 [Thermoprotei archaeon]